MNSNTGAIALFEKTKDAKKAGFDIPLTDAQALRLMPMDRPARIAEIPKLRRRFKVRRRVSR